ncbi:MAG: translesion error-prone DNA polymerase V autoproteolytic subunit [Bacteroidetes bacterium]|nr:translesion error-prone DNA polymerase V autoproteolytic subunit [Bacteroidota bacterium]
MSINKNKIDIYKSDPKSLKYLPLFLSKIECGFPSPANDYIEKELDLNKYVIRNPDSTFFGRVTGYSMEDEGIFPDDLVVIDKSITDYNNKICLCWYEGGFTLKKIEKSNNIIYLIPKNKKFPKIEVKEGEQFGVWGVVTFYFRKLT